MQTKTLLIKYNYLTPIKKTSYNEKSRTWNWLFKCDCGKEKIINIQQVRTNRTKSCGCLKNKNLNHAKGISSNKWTGETIIASTYINSIKRRAKLKKLLFNISDKYLQDLYLKQNGICKLSGLPLSIEINAFTASLDRIDSSVGYIEGNLQWLHKDINYMKYNLDQIDFLKLCKLITTKSHDKNNK